MNFTCCTVPQKKYKGTLTTIIYNRQVSTYDVVTVRKLTKKDSADLLTYVLCLVQITYIAKKKILFCQYFDPNTVFKWQHHFPRNDII